jgi:hypothetical protein
LLLGKSSFFAERKEVRFECFFGLHKNSPFLLTPIQL